MRINTNLVADSPAFACILLTGIKGTAISPLIAELLDLLLTGTVLLHLVPSLPLLGVQVLDEATLEQSVEYYFLRGIWKIIKLSRGVLSGQSWIRFEEEISEHLRRGVRQSSNVLTSR